MGQIICSKRVKEDVQNGSKKRFTVNIDVQNGQIIYSEKHVLMSQIICSKWAKKDVQKWFTMGQKRYFTMGQ